MEKLSDIDIQKSISKLTDWEYYDDAIHTSFEFDNFKHCINEMQRIAFECEALNHHPEWTNVYNVLDIKLTTHDVGGVTILDIELAEIIDKLIEVEE